MDPLRRLLFATSSWSQSFYGPEDEGADYEENEEAADDEGEGDEVGGDEDEGPEAADGDEGQDDDGDDEGEEDRPNQVAAKGKSRGENRIAAATRIAAEAKARAEAAERRLNEIENANRQQQNRETQAQREQRLALMDPDQRTQYLLAEQSNHFQSQLNAIRFEAQDSSDRTAFQGLCARNPVAAKHQEKVEIELQRLRATGSTAPRETILKYIIGDSALAATPRARGKAERTAAANRSRQSVRPASSRSDVPASGRRGSEKEQRYNRLKDLDI